MTNLSVNAVAVAGLVVGYVVVDLVVVVDFVVIVFVDFVVIVVDFFVAAVVG